MKNKTRLHKVVLDYIKNNPKYDYTNPEIQRNIETFGVLVDGKLVKNRLQWVYPSQEIVIAEWTKRDHGDFQKIQILEETNQYLVLFKPVGVVVEPGAGHQTKNLLSWLQESKKQSFYLVHRLDKDTQGLLLVAKSEIIQKFFQDQFRNRTTTKKYLAIVGKPVDNLLKIDNWQSRNKTNPIKQKFFWTQEEALEYDTNSRFASSTIKPVVCCPEMGYTLVEFEIKTGRMHQIRLQCEALGLVLIGEKIYNHNLQKPAITPGLQTEHLENSVKILDEAKFNELKKFIFGDVEYCLLSNYLKIQKPDLTFLEMEYKNVENIINNNCI